MDICLFIITKLIKLVTGVIKLLANEGEALTIDERELRVWKILIDNGDNMTS